MGLQFLSYQSLIHSSLSGIPLLNLRNLLSYFASLFSHNSILFQHGLTITDHLSNYLITSSIPDSQLQKIFNSMRLKSF